MPRGLREEGVGDPNFVLDVLFMQLCKKETTSSYEVMIFFFLLYFMDDSCKKAPYLLPIISDIRSCSSWIQVLLSSQIYGASSVKEVAKSD